MCLTDEIDFPVFSKLNKPYAAEQYDAAAYLIDKPLSWSSFRVVGLLRKLLGIKKVGHAGTLDPLATGLLIVCAGKKATRKVHLFQDAIKHYRAEVTFGYSTSSYDSETEPLEHMPYEHINRQMIQECLTSEFEGEIMQIPPMYAAIKQNGVPLYKLARKGQEVEREPRAVTIYQTEIHSYLPPILDLSITCSKGTYIRSISNDLGAYLQSRSHMSALRRTGIGNYPVSDALTIQELCNYLDPDGTLNLSV
jgi:tRNA pseudouridine55 synthase